MTQRRWPAALAAVSVRAALHGDGVTTVRVLGSSMWPVLRDGDEVRLSAATTRLGPGDIVALDSACGLVLHRALRVEQAHVVTRGDGVRSADAPSLRSAIVGVATHVRRGTGPWRPAPRGARVRIARALAFTRPALARVRRLPFGGS